MMAQIHGPGFGAVTLTISGFGLAIELIYLFIFLLHANDNKQRKYVGGIFLLELVVAGLVSGLVLGIVPSISTRSRIIGTICLVINVCMYAAPLTIIIMDINQV